MTTLDRYIFRNVLASSLAAVGVCTFVLLVANVVKDVVGLLASEQIDLTTFFRLTFMLTPYAVAFALPMGLLTGILLVLGRFSAQQEITAMRAAGWGVGRISRPIFALALIGAAASTWFNCDLGPRARGGFNQIKADVVRGNPLSVIVPREFVRSFPGYVIYVGAKDGSAVTELSVWKMDKQNRVVQHIRAESGTMEFDAETDTIYVTPRRGVVENRGKDNPEDFSRNPPLLNFAEWQRIPLSLEELVGKSTYRRKLSLMTYGELEAELVAARANAGGLPAVEVESRSAQIRYTIQKQLSYGGAVLAFALIGVPLGIKMQRKESSANLGLALVLALGFLFFQMMIDWTQKRPDLHPELLVWTPNLVFAGLGLWLFQRVDRR